MNEDKKLGVNEEKKQSSAINELNTPESIRRTEDEDRENWHWLSGERAIRLHQIRHAVTKLWQGCEEHYPPMPYYTPHGAAHSKSVEDIIHRLLPGKAYKKLKEIERYYLLAAAWTHDVGMIKGIEDDDDKRHPSQIRERHHERSERYIVNNYLTLDVEEKDAQALGLLAFFHRRKEHIEKCPELFVVGTETVRLRLLAAYIRLADALDVGQSRAPSSEYAICLAYNIPFTSKLHWIKSRLVSGIAVIPEEQKIMVHFKQPHEQDLKDYCSKTEEYNKQRVEQNLKRLRHTVINGLREELDSVKTTLIRGGITMYLDITSVSTEMVIDDQVFPEIIRLAEDLDMIIHPSATRLILLLLETIENISERYINPTNKNNGCKIEKCNNKCNNNIACHMPKMIKEEMGKFISEVKDGVIEQRKCHIGMKKIVSHLEYKIRDENLSEIILFVRRWREEIQLERRCVRYNSYIYFREHLINKEKIFKNLTANSRSKTRCRVNEDQVVFDIEKIINDLIQKELKKYSRYPSTEQEKQGDRKGNDENGKDSWLTNCINILVYGYSELVIKALAGFRDVVISIAIKSLNDIAMKTCENNSRVNIINIIHKINIEEVASKFFRIFVCEGQPKTITAPNDTLQYHDGTRFAIALSRMKFENVIIIPDLVAGSLLNSGVSNCSCVENKNKQLQIDYILLGVNGVLLNKQDVENDNKDVFLHSSGHMAIANLVRYKHQLGNSFSPRLILVMSMSKCDFYQIDNTICVPDKEEDKEEFSIKDGYRFWKWYGEKTREEAFFARDAEVQKELFEHNIALYNPKEDEVELSIVNDIISDKNFILDIQKNRQSLIKDIDEYNEYLTKEKLHNAGCPACTASNHMGAQKETVPAADINLQPSKSVGEDSST